MGYQVIGVDNHVNYYDPKIKENRLNKFIKNEDYIHVRCDLEDKDKIEKIFIEHKINSVVNLAAQAGVRVLHRKSI